MRTDAATLARHPDHPLVRPLLAHKEAATRLSSFGPSFADHVNPASGRIHANFRLGATASGRMACFDPNLQNPPREAAFRALFRAPEGRRMVVADYAQIELRVAAEVAGDRTMLDAYRRGEDLHRRTAAAIAGVDVEDVTPEQRQLAKAVNFGLLYGQGARGLASYARASYGVDMTVAEAAAAREAFFATYSGLATWQRESAREAERAMLVRTRSGRVFDFRRSRFGYSYPEALNIPIQGAAAEVLMAALGALPERLAGLDAKLVNVVHDELVLEVAESDLDRTRDALEQAMVAGMLAVFPNAPTEGLVDASVGQDWADAK